MKASFFFPSLPSSGSFLCRRFLIYTRSLAFFSSGVGLMRASAKLRVLSVCLWRLPLLMSLPAYFSDLEDRRGDWRIDFPRLSCDALPLATAWRVITRATHSDTLSFSSRSTTFGSLDRAPFFESERSTLVTDIFTHVRDVCRPQSHAVACLYLDVPPKYRGPP